MQRANKGFVALLLWLGACGGAVGATGAGGESHFLRHCFEGCGSLSCVADLCTRSCLVAKNDCGDLATNAQCTNASVEPGSVAVCDLGCETNADCSALGSGFACEGGFCRSTTTEPAGEAGAPAASGSGSGGSGSAAGGSSGGSAGANDTCLLPFEAGPCKASISVFAYEDGACVPKTYGGCEGNANRFSSLEQCLAVCQGQPTAADTCTGNRVPKDVCLECGPAGGCGLSLHVCSQPCDDQTPCESPYLTCFEGTCQVYGCE